MPAVVLEDLKRSLQAPSGRPRRLPGGQGCVHRGRALPRV